MESRNPNRSGLAINPASTMTSPRVLKKNLIAFRISPVPGSMKINLDGLGISPAALRVGLKIGTGINPATVTIDPGDRARSLPLAKPFPLLPRPWILSKPRKPWIYSTATMLF
jgi:hypothetical protein